MEKEPREGVLFVPGDATYRLVDLAAADANLGTYESVIGRPWSQMRPIVLLDGATRAKRFLVYAEAVTDAQAVAAGRDGRESLALRVARELGLLFTAQEAKMLRTGRSVWLAANGTSLDVAELSAIV